MFYPNGREKRNEEENKKKIVFRTAKHKQLCVPFTRISVHGEFGSYYFLISAGVAATIFVDDIHFVGESNENL